MIAPFTTSRGPRDRGVSPVIGVILMVAITVILAAVIGTFVLTLGSDVQENVQAGASATFDTQEHQIRVTWASNRNADFLWVNTTGMSAQEGRHRLGQVGASLTMKTGAGDDTLDTSLAGTRTEQDAQFSHGDSITVTITAVKGDASTVIVSKTETV